MYLGRLRIKCQISKLEWGISNGGIFTFSLRRGQGEGNAWANEKTLKILDCAALIVTLRGLRISVRKGWECSSMVEQRPFKPLVGGSSPPAPTTFFPQENAFFCHAKKPKTRRFRMF